MTCLKTVRLKAAGGLNKYFRFFFPLIFCIATVLLSGARVNCAYAQTKGERDSLVRLLDAKSASLIENMNGVYRKVIGPARFFHNNTYLLCDSAIWNVVTNVIDAMGHVQIIQQTTYLVGDQLTYLSDQNLAQFRGAVVHLYNRKGDQLKTKFLDYNTKDSIATFYDGGCLRDSKGNIIEGNSGTYNAGKKEFAFYTNVMMFSDSVYVRGDQATYNSPAEMATFGTHTTAWKERDTLYTNMGEYFTKPGMLSLKKDNYISTKEQEVWANLVNYYRKTGNAELFDNVQIKDTVNSVVLMGDKGLFNRKPMIATMTEKPVAAMYSKEKSGYDSLKRETLYKLDTLFLAADTLKMRLVRRCDVDTNLVKICWERKMLADRDPMVEIDSLNAQYLAVYRKNKKKLGTFVNPYSFKMSSSASGDGGSRSSGARNAQEERSNPPAGRPGDKNSARPGNEFGKATEEIVETPDTTGNALKIKLAKIKKDSLAVARKKALIGEGDTTNVIFMDAYHHVKIFKSDLRGVCDSLVYAGIDSIARFYKKPALWNEDKNQFTADSIELSIRNNNVYKGNLIENAYIISQEDSIHFDQVKSTEMVAYFRDNDVYRFDALGGASAILFIKERDSAITLMNQKESKILSAHIINRKIQRIRYVENLKSDVRPTYKLPVDKQRLKNFNWRISEMPRSRWELTDRKVHTSQRGTLAKIVFPDYPQTKIYFPKSYETITALAKSIDKKIAAENASEAKQAETKRAGKSADNNKQMRLIGIQKAEPEDIQNARPANTPNARPANTPNTKPTDIKNIRPAK
jgi:lipopolysaccharide export system protein LptA